MKNKARLFSNLQILFSVMNVIVTVLILSLFDVGFVAIILGLLIAQIISILVAVYIEREFWGRTVTALRFYSFQKSKTMLAYGIPFIPTISFEWILQNVDRFYLKEFSGFHQLGIYVTALKFSAVLNIVQIGFTTFWVPFFYERYHKDPGDKDFYSRTFNIVLVAITTLISFAGFFSPLVKFLLPVQYHQAISFFPLMMVGPMFLTLSYITYVGIDLTKKTYYHIIISLLTCITNVIAGYILIPRYGLWGAIFSSTLSYLLLFLLRSYVSFRLYPINFEWKKLIPIMAVLIATLIATSIDFTYTYKPLLLVNIIACVATFYYQIFSIRSKSLINK